MLYVDADACPVKAEAEEVASRLKVRLFMVSNGGLRPSANPVVEMVYVASGADEADKWIATRVGRGDVVVTAGEPLTPANIGQILATRDLMADLRAADPFRQGAGRGFTKADRSRFLDALDRALRAAERDAAND